RAKSINCLNLHVNYRPFWRWKSSDHPKTNETKIVPVYHRAPMDGRARPTVDERNSRAYPCRTSHKSSTHKVNRTAKIDPRTRFVALVFEHVHNNCGSGPKDGNC